jgi:hypothetical protein
VNVWTNVLPVDFGPDAQNPWLDVASWVIWSWKRQVTEPPTGTFTVLGEKLVLTTSTVALPPVVTGLAEPPVATTRQAAGTVASTPAPHARRFMGGL